jgi:hypothetical protein
MTHIVVDDQQAKLIAETSGSIEIRDRQGFHLGYVAHGFSDEDIVIAKRRSLSEETRFTTQQVVNRLRSRGEE